MLHRQMFICSAIEKCRETVNCCPHKQPHIKDERCVPRQCRYAAGVETVDCDPYDPAHPRAPVPVPVSPAKTVEQKMKEENVKSVETIKQEVTETKTEIKGLTDVESGDKLVATTKEPAQEQDIKEAVKKQAAAQQRPVKIHNKEPKKSQGRKKGE